MGVKPSIKQMRLLYIADNGFSQKDGKFYYSLPNHVNTIQYLKFFSDIIYIARTDSYSEGDIEIPKEHNVYLFDKTDFRGMRQALIQHQDEYDVVLTRNGINGCLIPGLAKNLHKVLVSYCGADPIDIQFSKGTLKGKIVGILWYLLERRKMRLADYAHYCTEFLHKKYPCKSEYLICSNVSIKIDENVPTKRRYKIDSHTGKYLVGLMGKIDNGRKGIDVAIEAIERLGDDYELEIVGGGNQTEWKSILKQKNLTDRVRFLGYYSNRSDIDHWFDELDIYIQPSLSEGLPRATIEAMARALPVVATNVSGLPEIIDRDFLIPKNDVTALTEKIHLIATDKKIAHLQSNRNFEVSKDYQESVRDDKLNRFYGQICQTS